MGRVAVLEQRVRDLEDELRRLGSSDLLLEESEARLRLCLEATGIGLWSWEHGTDRVVWDNRLCAIYGREAGRGPRDYAEWRDGIHPDDRERVEAHVGNAVSSGVYREIEHRIVRTDGSVRWVCARGSVQRDASGNVMRLLGAVLDVTDRHDIEDRLRDAQKMEAVARLAAGIAHNFNNLLAVVIPSVEEAARLVPEAETHLGPARDAAGQAAAIVRELARLAGSESRRVRTRRDLGVIARKTVEFARKTFDRWIRWEVEIADSLPTVSVDAGQIEQVLLNVLINARDALRVAPGRDPTIAVRVSRDDATVVVSVSDTGPGMDESTRARVFEPFFTTKGPAAGTGLGLSTAYAIAREHDGAISCASAPGAGAVVTLTLPIDVRPAPRRRSAVAAAALQGKGEHVLVVDDEPLIRRVLHAFLEHAGYVVHEASDGEVAIEVLSDLQARVDAVILDQSMPGVGGLGVMSWVMRERPALRVIGYSGLDREIAGVRARLTKPVEPDVLLATLRSVLDEA